MRIDEITEATPGTSRLAGLVGNIRNKFTPANQEPSEDDFAKSNLQVWYNNVKKLQRSGVDMTNPDVYRENLIKFLTSSGKRSIGTSLENRIKRVDLTEPNLTSIMKLAKRKIVKAKPSTTAQPRSIPGGTTQKAGGIEYVWNGSEWRRSDNGQPASDSISAALSASITGTA